VTTTVDAPGRPGRQRARGASRARTPASRRWRLLPTLALVAGALYCLLPVIWVPIAATKTGAELFTSLTLLPGHGLVENLRDLSAYRGGQFWRWMLNSAIYTGVGAALSAALSAVTGYALAKYRFRGSRLIFNVLIAGVLVPQITLAVPQYLLLAKVGMAGPYWSVLLPSIISPYGIYLARIYAAAAIPDEMVEAARLDTDSELRIFRSVALPLMLPGMVTVFLVQFVAIWNNFLLPFIMLSDDDKFPITVGLYTLLSQGASRPVLYTLVITGAMLSIIPLVALFLSLQRYWRLDLITGGLKG
jgi:multiple sugar transport system permease protein